MPKPKPGRSSEAKINPDVDDTSIKKIRKSFNTPTELQSLTRTIEGYCRLSPGPTQTNRGLQGRLSQTMKINGLHHNHMHKVDLTLVAVIAWIDYQSIYISLG